MSKDQVPNLDVTHVAVHKRVCRPRGYALILTLVVLALTAVMVGGLAHRSGAEALLAQQAERDLRTRWAETSARRALMPAMQNHLEAKLAQWRTENAQGEGSPPVAVLISLDLMGVSITARLDDQQAVPNLNRLAHMDPSGGWREIGSVFAPPSVPASGSLLPLDSEAASRLGTPRLIAWGQVYPAVDPRLLSGLEPLRDHQPVGLRDWAAATGPTRHGLTTGVTLWGDGKLNAWTSSPETLHHMFDRVIGADQVSRLVELRTAHRAGAARGLVEMLGLSADERARMQLSLCDRSRTYALWLAVTVQQEDHGGVLRGLRPCWSLTVVEGAAGSTNPNSQVFRW